MNQETKTKIKIIAVSTIIGLQLLMIWMVNRVLIRLLALLNGPMP